MLKFHKVNLAENEERLCGSWWELRSNFEINPLANA